MSTPSLSSRCSHPNPTYAYPPPCPRPPRALTPAPSLLQCFNPNLTFAPRTPSPTSPLPPLRHCSNPCFTSAYHPPSPRPSHPPRPIPLPPLVLSEEASRAWPLGLVLFYLDRYHEAANSLDTDISLFEAKFEESATDERIWQAAAIIRAAQQAGGDVANIVAGLRPLDIAEPDVLRRTVYDVRQREQKNGCAFCFCI